MYCKTVVANQDDLGASGMEQERALFLHGRLCDLTLQKNWTYKSKKPALGNRDPFCLCSCGKKKKKNPLIRESWSSALLKNPPHIHCCWQRSQLSYLWTKFLSEYSVVTWNRGKTREEERDSEGNSFLALTKCFYNHSVYGCFYLESQTGKFQCLYLEVIIID